MCKLETILAIPMAVALGGCIGSVDTPARSGEPPKAASVGGGPPDVPPWCSGLDAPVPVEPASLPPPGSKMDAGVDPCPGPALPGPTTAPPPPRAR
jgi:hypothetical protein